MSFLRGKRFWALATMVAIVSILTPATASAQVRLFNYDILSSVVQVDEVEPLKPIVIAGTRNGTFSGCVGVESSAAIKGLKAVMSPLSGSAGEIPADAVQVRYATSWGGNFGRWEPRGLDILHETPPAAVSDRKQSLAGVWVTVTVPAEAAAGKYSGQLTVEAEGLAPQTLPVELTVAEWTVPETQQWRTWIEMLQSPDTLAVEYDLELWSDRHWEMIARSMQMIGQMGSRVVFIPLISQTNQGNEQSMVRWVRKADGSFSFDYSIMEKYLDMAEKHMGKPKMVVFYAWDTCMIVREQRPTVDPKAPAYTQQQQVLAQKRWDLQQKGITVTVVDEATGEAKTEYVPHLTAPESRPRWQAIFDHARKTMQQRGLEDTMVLGMITDEQPSREQVQVLHEISGGLPWISHCHPGRMRGRPPVGNKMLHGIADVRYEAHVYNMRWEADPAKKRNYGWQTPELRAFFGRHGIPNGHPLTVRMLPELQITGYQRGVGRIGADFWYVMKNPRGQRSGAVYARYPENMWRNLNIDSWLLAPGADGPISTARFENMREGLQECEARIFIESVLLDEQKKARLGAPLATRAQKVLDDRQRAMWRSIWTNEEHLKIIGSLGVHGNARNPQEAIWQALSSAKVDLPQGRDAQQMKSGEFSKGVQWFAKSDWQQRNADLYNIAAEVQKKIGR